MMTIMQTISFFFVNQMLFIQCKMYQIGKYIIINNISITPLLMNVDDIAGKNQ